MNEKQLRKMINDTPDVTVDDMIDKSVTAKNVGELIDQSWYQLAQDSEIYEKSDDAVADAEDALRALKLPKKDKDVVYEYTSAFESRCAVINDLAYEAGFRDCVKLLKYLGLIKTEA